MFLVFFYQRGVVKPPGGTLPLGLCGVTVTGSSETITPGQPISSPVNGLTEKTSSEKTVKF
jgi:hypothetical protein